ncbi:response regulator [Pontiella sp.]|uniref:response regulator n=1 Tax=Pontiella sp. TaxID=2837462 RepID=UPI00356A462D
MESKIKVMLVEDNAAYRKALARSLAFGPDIELAGEYGTAEVALRNLQDLSTRNAPDVILLDLNLPGMSGHEAIPWFKKSVPDAQIIVLTQSDKEADVLAAISAGANGYLLKSATIDRLHDGIRSVVEGGSILDTGVARFLLNLLQKNAPKTEEENRLTERELEVLSLIAEGMAKKEVAVQLGISARTVAIHAAHIYKKLDVPNAPAAVNKAYKTGLL